MNRKRFWATAELFDGYFYVLGGLNVNSSQIPNKASATTANLTRPPFLSVCIARACAAPASRKLLFTGPYGRR